MVVLLVCALRLLLRVDANCSLSDFAKIATVIRSRCPRATFQPSLCEAQSPTQGLQESQVLFDSLHDISQCIRLGGDSDLLALVAKGKKINGAEVAEDCALRLFGGTLAENEDGKYPFIFRLAGSLHGTLPNGVFDVLRRENRLFDYRNSVYVNKLERSRVSMHEAISESGVVIGEDGDIYWTTDSAFALRWSRLSIQYSRHLPNAARGQNEALGVVQLRERVGATVPTRRYSTPCRHAHRCGSAPPAGIVATGHTWHNRRPGTWPRVHV